MNEIVAVDFDGEASDAIIYHYADRLLPLKKYPQHLLGRVFSLDKGLAS